MLERAATEAGIPLKLLLAGVIAESGLNPHAERYGVWPDVSFGYSQIIVMSHWAGNHLNTPENIEAVRQAVFADPQCDLSEMATRLAGCLETARQSNLEKIGGDELLGALIVYNAGHWPTEGWWWSRWGSNVDSYEVGLAEATRRLA